MEPVQHLRDNQGQSNTDFSIINGLRVRTMRAGVGEPLLLLHGWGSSIQSFDQMIRDFSRFYAVVAFDFPGHGESDLPPAPWGVHDFMNFTLSLMDEFSLARPTILAHSFGGRVAISLAALHPDRVSKLILVGAAGIPPPRSVKRSIRRVVVRIGKALGSLGPPGRWMREHLVAQFASTDYLTAGAMRGTFVKIVGEDLTQLLPRIKAKTLLMWGETDMESPLDTAQRMRDLIPGAQLIIMKNAGHFPFIDQFGRFRLDALRFLRA